MSEEYSNGYARGYEAGQESMLKLAEQPAQQEPVALEQERKAFEEWIDSGFINKGHAAFHKFGDRDAYCIAEIQNKWKAWKERAKRTSPQPAQQEPVAILNHAHGIHTVRSVKLNGLPDGEYNLYTSPQPAQRKPLTDERIESVRHMRDVQGYDGNWNYDPYMQGLYNGLEFALSLIEVREPQFKDAPETWLGDIKVKYKLSSRSQTEAQK